MSEPATNLRQAITSLRCTVCTKIHGLEERYKCPACGGILDVVYNWQSSTVMDVMQRVQTLTNSSMWAFHELLPVKPDTKPVSLGEGWTPLIQAGGNGPWAGLNDVWLKLEGANPTGSFKDRPVSVAVTKARELGVEGVITASSGNAGAAVSAYAARAGLPSITLVPDGLPDSKLVQIGMPGTRLIAVRGHFSRAFDLAYRWANEAGWYNVTTTQLSAFPTEGNKTVAYELWLQLGRVPDWIVIPVSSGPLLVGALKGFRELRDAGLSDQIPRMVAVQAEGCAPIVRAFESGATEVHAWSDPDTVAFGINDPLQGYADDGTRTLADVKETGGSVIAVSDMAILNAAHNLARREGVLAEPTGAVALAGLELLAGRGIIKPDECIVCLVTGHGLKDPHTLGTLIKPPRVIDPELVQLDRALDGQAEGEW